MATPEATSTPTPTAGLPSAPPTATLTPTPTLSPIFNQTAATGVARPVLEQTRGVRLPEDEAAHDVPVEWWYFNGHLVDAGDVRYSFHYVAFHVGDAGSSFFDWRLMHLTLATSSEGVVAVGAMGSRGRGEQPDWGFATTIQDWAIQGADGRYSLKVTKGDYSFNLDLEETKVPVLHGGDGIIQMGTGGESYYYSRTRLSARGTVTSGDASHEVTGEAWMDHQWGDFGREPLKWDWFSIQLSDNTELMAYLFQDQETGEFTHRAGTYVLADGSSQSLGQHDLEVTPLRSWTSPTTNVNYPMGWRLRIAPLELELELQETHRDSEYWIEGFTPAPYWEGAVTVSGMKGGDPITGRGFVELVGYGPETP